MTTHASTTGSKVVALLAGGALVASGLFAFNATRQQASAQDRHRKTPIDRTVEAKSGIRVLAAHVVGAGGIVELTYQVTDPSKASIVEGDVTKTPLLTEDGSGRQLHDTAAMRHGHSMRAAGTYFLLYYNKDRAVRVGDTIDVTIAGVVLRGVPVS